MTYEPGRITEVAPQFPLPLRERADERTRSPGEGKALINRCAWINQHLPLTPRDGTAVSSALSLKGRGECLPQVR